MQSVSLQGHIDPFKDSLHWLFASYGINLKLANSYFRPDKYIYPLKDVKVYKEVTVGYSTLPTLLQQQWPPNYLF